MTVLIFAIGAVPYKEDALAVLRDYFEHNKYSVHVVEASEGRNPHKLHPSWLKTVAHRFVDDDFILCWDLDLLPVSRRASLANVFSGSINMATDTALYFTSQRVVPEFAYNGGLLGIPRHEFAAFEDLYNRVGPVSKLASWEQYPVNQMLWGRKGAVHRLPWQLNFSPAHVPYQSALAELQPLAHCVHYNFIGKDNRVPLVAEHRVRYFEDPDKELPRIDEPVIGNDFQLFDSRKDMISLAPLGGTVAEVGVFVGNFSDAILEVVRPKMLYLIDVYSGITYSGDVNGQNIRKADMGAEYTRQKEKRVNQPVTFLRGWSGEMLESLPAASLDMAYIDADHRYPAVTRDLDAAYRAVKPGGWIMGHDYHPIHHPGTFLAVNRFCNRRGLKVSALSADKLPSYAIRRP